MDSIGRMSKYVHYSVSKVLVLSGDGQNKVSLSLSDNVRCNGYLVLKKVY